jgi:hypothetical protein
MRVHPKTTHCAGEQYAPGLSRLFSTQVMKELSAKGYSQLACKVIEETKATDVLDPTMQLRDFFDWLYLGLFRSYRNEYVYKNAIAAKILLGKHSLNSSFMLTEFRAANCKADTVVLNGTSNVYEIKSEFDNLDRLGRQIAAYRKLFDMIHVITSEKQVEKVLGAVDKNVGVMILSNRDTIRTVRKSASSKSEVDPSVIFDSLRRPEYVQIIKAQFGHAPKVPNTRMYETCKQLFCQLTPDVAHDEMVRVLKKRGSSQSLSDFITGVPRSLKAASLSCQLSRKEQAAFLNLLDRDIGHCLLRKQWI